MSKLTKLVSEAGHQSRYQHTIKQKPTWGEKSETIYLHETEINFPVTCSAF